MKDSSGGGGWIRTTEAHASDLQSDPFGHSGTPPRLDNGAGTRNRTRDLLITSQLLYLLSYTGLVTTTCVAGANITQGIRYLQYPNYKEFYLTAFAADLWPATQRLSLPMYRHRSYQHATPIARLHDQWNRLAALIQAH